MADVPATVVTLQYNAYDPSDPGVLVLYPDVTIPEFSIGMHKIYDRQDFETVELATGVLRETQRKKRLAIEMNLHFGNFTDTTTGWQNWLFVREFLMSGWRVINFPQVTGGATTQGLDAEKLNRYLSDQNNEATMILTEDSDPDFETYTIKGYTFKLVLNQPLTVADINALP